MASTPQVAEPSSGARVPLAVARRATREGANLTYMAGRRVRLQLLLRKEWRTREGVAAVLRELRALDMRPTGSGAATVSAEVGVRAFERRFGSLSAVVRFETDTLETPPSLRDCVESITVAPRHTYMRKRPKRAKR